MKETSAAINQEGKNLMQLLCEYYKCNENKLISKMREVKDDEKTKLLEFLRNFDLVDHLQKPVKIKDLSLNNSRQHRFTLKNQQNQISVEEYFLNKYQKKLDYPTLPLLATEKQNFIPLEVCYLKPTKRSNLNPDEQSKMVIFKIYHIKLNY